MSDRGSVDDVDGDGIVDPGTGRALDRGADAKTALLERGDGPGAFELNAHLGRLSITSSGGRGWWTERSSAKAPVRPGATLGW